ncbi:CHRD domain-containing protein [Bradyrhizobium cenepequi]|uniref:CHRD domain-containing protein n=1 Tax=Bradyrhizobium cenepequi TaxID=2821403 RepID=UPI001CE2508B|nr:CHRD domain-containing protein [Bradyrhizobium cenepequi]MCA6109147.1 CHRD domain-containing protein [Bradyrhizobium cenepequi]
MSTAFRVVLEGTQEVPPTGSTASGLGTVIFDSAAITASYSFQIDGLDFGPVTGGPGQTPSTDDDVEGMHFHNQVRGVNGPIVFGQIHPAQDNDDLAITQNADGSWMVSGIWETTDPANASIADFAATLGSAAVGSEVPIYFNVHSAPFPGGEIRGQLVAIADDNANVIEGTAGNDLLPGLGGDDVILGRAGDDTIQGGDGNDFLSGGRGNDNINTGQGNDVVLGGAGDDSIGGMAGRDIVQGGAGDDFIAWNDPTGDVVFGGRGNDTILGGNVAADEIHGGAGDDLIRAFATSPEEATASDKLFGDGGNDVVIGGNAADTIEGGRGNDFLTGNDGADTFVFRDNQTGDDIITDFDPSEDVVQLEGFDASFDPLAALTAQPLGTELDLGGGNSVLFQGRTLAEFSADDFQLV